MIRRGGGGGEVNVCSKNLQQGRSDGKGTGYRGDNTCQKKSRLSAESGLSTNPHKCAYRPMTISWRYYDISFFTSRRDGLKILGLPVTYGPVCLKIRISKNSIFQEQDIFSKNRQKIITKNFVGLCPASPPYGAAPLPPPRARCYLPVCTFT